MRPTIEGYGIYVYISEYIYIYIYMCVFIVVCLFVCHPFFLGGGGGGHLWRAIEFLVGFDKYTLFLNKVLPQRTLMY